MTNSTIAFYFGYKFTEQDIKTIFPEENDKDDDCYLMNLIVGFFFDIPLGIEKVVTDFENSENNEAELIMGFKFYEFEAHYDAVRSLPKVTSQAKTIVDNFRKLNPSALNDRIPEILVYLNCNK